MRDVHSPVVLAPRRVSGGLDSGIGQWSCVPPGHYSGVSEDQPRGRVLIVDDDPFTRAMLGSVVEGLGFEVTGSAATFAEALTLARQSLPDVALVDLDLGEGPTGIDLAHGMRRTQPNLGVVFLSTYVEPRLLGSVPQLPRGAIYLTKQEVAETAVLGDALMSAATAGAGGEWSSGADSRLVGLSDSQVEVMRLIAAGYSNAEIARRLVIEEASVEKAVMRLIRQLDIKATRQENQRVLIAQAYSALSGARFVRRD